MAKKYYTQLELDEYVRKLLTNSEIALSKQAEKIENEKKVNAKLQKELDEYKKKEKTISRALIIADRKAKYIESTTRSRCAIEIERLARLAEKWDDFFNELEDKYAKTDKEKLEEFKDELSKVIDSMMDMENMFDKSNLSEAEQSHSQEISRLKVIKEKKQNELDERFSKLKLEFDMKIGDNATRGRGRPKKKDSLDIKKIQSPNYIRGNQKSKANTVYPPIGESGFDFNEAMNPTDSLEDIMKDLFAEEGKY